MGSCCADRKRPPQQVSASQPDKQQNFTNSQRPFNTTNNNNVAIQQETGHQRPQFIQNSAASGQHYGNAPPQGSVNQSSAAYNSNVYQHNEREMMNNSARENQNMVGGSLIVPSSSRPPRAPISASQSGVRKEQNVSIVQGDKASGEYQIRYPGSEVKPGNQSRISGASAHSISRQKQPKIVQLQQSKVHYKSQKAGDSESIVSAIRIKGFNEEQYIGRKVKPFQLTAEIPGKNLIKDSNYFDESNGPIDLQPELSTSFADFRVGDTDQLTTFPAKTYLFNVDLMEKIVS